MADPGQRIRMLRMRVARGHETSLMQGLRFITLDPAPTLYVVALSAAVILALRVTQAWADKRAQERTERAVRAIERDSNART
jgi:hypothetical protein